MFQKPYKYIIKTRNNEINVHSRTLLLLQDTILLIDVYARESDQDIS